MRVLIRTKDGYHDRFGVDHACGTVADLPESIALKLLLHGIAEPVVETATVEPRRNAAKRTTRPKGRSK